MQRVFKHLPKTLVGDEEAMHEMRVAARRLRVTLPVLARKPRGKRVRRALAVLREVTRASGRGRELDVALEFLEARLRAVGRSSPESDLLRGQLANAIHRSRRRMANAMLDIEIAGLRRDLRAIVKGGSADDFTVLGRLRETRNALGRVLVRGLEALGSDFDPKALHRLRRQARRLRYAAEVSDALAGQGSDSPAALKDLQDRLGRIQDNQVVGGWFSGAAVAARARGQAAVATEAGSLAEWFDEQSRGHHRDLLEGDPVHVVTRALEAMNRARTAA